MTNKPHQRLSTQASASKPGPKPRLSKEMIVAKACDLLGGGAGDFTMASLAKELNAGAMSLYRYFPNRDDLLDAVAAHLVELWKPPQTEGRSWQEIVIDFLWETQRLWDEYPNALRTVFWRSRHSALWVEVWLLPLAKALKKQGFSDDQLAFALSWLGTSAIGVVVVEPDHPGNVAVETVLTASALSESERRLASELSARMRIIDRKRLREFSFKNIVIALESILGASPSEIGR